MRKRDSVCRMSSEMKLSAAASPTINLSSLTTVAFNQSQLCIAQLTERSTYIFVLKGGRYIGLMQYWLPVKLDWLGWLWTGISRMSRYSIISWTRSYSALAGLLVRCQQPPNCNALLRCWLLINLHGTRCGVAPSVRRVVAAAVCQHPVINAVHTSITIDQDSFPRTESTKEFYIVAF